MDWQMRWSTNIYQELGDPYQLVVYEWSDSVDPVYTNIDLIDRFKLKRGKASVKDKFDRIISTQIDFSILDKGRVIQNLMAGKPEGNFKGVIRKNYLTYFTGYLTQYMNSYDITKPDTVLSLKLYDGISWLKNIKDFSIFPTETGHLSEILYDILNYLRFDIGIYVYTNLYQNPSNPTYHLGVKIKDYIAIKPEASLYDILDMILSQFQFRLFQENNYWHIQQVLSLVATDPPVGGVKREYIAPDSSITTDKISIKNTFEVSELEWSPKEFDLDPYGQIDINVKCNGPKTIPYQYKLAGTLEWLNPYFNYGLQNPYGWNIIAGGAYRFTENSLQLEPGAIASQYSGLVSGSLLAADETVIISYNVLCIRMVKELADRLDHTTGNENKLFYIFFLGSDATTYYLNRNTFEWQTTLDDWCYFGLDVFGFDVYNYDTSQFEFAEEYSCPTLKDEIEITVPSNTSGQIGVKLFGGTAPTQSLTDYPYQVTAQFNYFNISRKYVDNNPASTVPKNLRVSSKIDDSTQLLKIKTLDIPFHDKDPYVNAHIWVYYDDPGDPPERWIGCNGNWYPNNKQLLKYIVEELVEMNYACNKGIDITFTPGKDISFKDLFQGDIYSTGSDRYYLPCYEETDLIKDKRRFICLLHETHSHALITNFEFPMGIGDTPQQDLINGSFKVNMTQKVEFKSTGLFINGKQKTPRTRYKGTTADRTTLAATLTADDAWEVEFADTEMNTIYFWNGSSFI